MHKLESFALSCGAKINKPTIEKSFFPILDKKFICVSQLSYSGSKEYNYFNDVLFHIKPFLDEHNISILEIGNYSKPTLFYAKRFHNLTRLQYNYIISKSIGYLGNLNIFADISSYYNKKFVSPINNDYEDLIKPYWLDEKSYKILKPSSDKKPVVGEESSKSINEIYPEKIAHEFLNLIKIKNNLNKLKTIFIGEEYINNVIDIIPEGKPLINNTIQDIINLRMDKNFNLDFLIQSKGLSKLNIVTDRIIPFEYLNYIKDKITIISFFVSKKTTIDDIKSLQRIGKPINFLCKDEKNINDIRLKFMDYDIKLFGIKKLKDVPFKMKSNLKFLSKRNIILDEKGYNSYYSIKNKHNNTNIYKVSNFLEDLPFSRIYEDNS